jgi:molecular chaperone GrpE
VASVTKKSKKTGKKELALEKKVRELEKKCQEYLNDVQRIQAEFENFKKRLEREKQEFVSFANSKLIEEFLPVLDSIDSALKNKQGSEVQGLIAIKKQLMQVLEKHGLKEIKSVGEKFNPQVHECLMQECIKEKENEIVLEEFQKGYLLNGKVLRAAKVKINKTQ